VRQDGRLGEKLMSCLEPVDQYLRNFQWNTVKYRTADKSIADLIHSLQKVRRQTNPRRPR
jgi:V-type H+-transporting ATPase subunit C